MANDHDDEVPADIGLTWFGDYGYLTATYGDPDGDHDHVEIKLDPDRLAQLVADCNGK